MGSIYIFLAKVTHSPLEANERRQKKMLLLSRPSSSSSIHDAHFLCLQHIVVVVVVATFAFDSIFYPSDFFRCSCCAGPKPHCVLFRLQIAPSLLVCSHFRRRVCVSVFFAWIPYDFSPLYALRGVHLSEIFFILARFYCRRCRLSQCSLFFLPFENNSINIVLCVFDGVYCSVRTTAIHRKVDISPTRNFASKTIKISTKNEKGRENMSKKTFSPFRYFLCVCVQSLIFFLLLFVLHSLDLLFQTIRSAATTITATKLHWKLSVRRTKKKSKDENHITKMRMASVWNQIGERMRKREKKSVQIHFNEKAANAKRMMSRTFQLNGKIECWWRTNFLLKKEWKKQPEIWKEKMYTQWILTKADISWEMIKIEMENDII